MRRTILHSVAILLAFAAAAVSAPSASEVLSKAKDKAAKENKTIFLDFSASW